MTVGSKRFSSGLTAALVLAVSAAAPQALAKGQKSARRPPQAHATPADDGLGSQDVYLSADEMVTDQTDNSVTAVGHAEARYQGRIIRARKITYNADTGATHASGDVFILSPDGTQQFAQEIDLDDDMNTGVALAFAARLQNNVTLAAGAAIRRNEQVLELNQGTVTTCKTCKADGTSRAPTFAIEASRILQDHARQVVYYRNAVIKIWGVPVFYSPVFWHPDPAAERRSGLLIPRISIGNKRGLSIEQPYLWVISPSADLTISPQFNSTVNPFLNLHLRERFYSGRIDIRAGVTDEKKFDNNVKYGTASPRSYLLGSGLFNIDKATAWGFGAERVSDQTLFRRYGVRDVYSDHGPIGADTSRLISQLFVQREDDQSWLSATALSFQSLRPVGSAPIPYKGKVYYEPTFEKQSTFPTVAPMIEGRYDHALFGGRLNISGSMVALHRSEPVKSVYDPTGVQTTGPMAISTGVTLPTGVSAMDEIRYTDSSQASVSLDWRRSFIFPVGLRIDPFINGRTDAFTVGDGQAYKVTYDINKQQVAETPAGAIRDSTNRSFMTLGADLSYPMIRTFGSTGSIIIEPLAQLAISPKTKVDLNIPNEDSTAFDFDESTLFSLNRFPGFDLYEGGARANLAVRTTISLNPTQKASFLIGRSYHSDVQPLFSPQSGLRKTSSDWVTYATLQPFANFSLFNRARISRDSFTVQREEVGANAGFGPVNGSISYNYNTSGLAYVAVAPVNGSTVTYKAVVGRVEDMNISGALKVARNWGLEVNAARDMRYRLFPTAQIGVFYQDDCIRIDVLYHHNETLQGFGAKIGASDGIGVRLTVVTLGDAQTLGVRRNDAR